MMTDKFVLHFQLAQKYSKIQILMPQIPHVPLEIKKGVGFANLYNEGQVFAETFKKRAGVHYITVSFLNGFRICDKDQLILALIFRFGVILV